MQKVEQMMFTWGVHMEKKDVLTLAVAIVGLTLGLIQYHESLPRHRICPKTPTSCAGR
jgi:hypothetical protein